jgi:hypothetical protein
MTTQALPARRRHSHLVPEGERTEAEINAGGQAKPPRNQADAQMGKGHVTNLVHQEDLDDTEVTSGATSGA